MLDTKGDYEFANRLNYNLAKLTEAIERANELKEIELRLQTEMMKKE